MYLESTSWSSKCMQILNSALHLNTDLPFLYIKSLLKKKRKTKIECMFICWHLWQQCSWWLFWQANFTKLLNRWSHGYIKVTRHQCIHWPLPKIVTLLIILIDWCTLLYLAGNRYTNALSRCTVVEWALQ